MSQPHGLRYIYIKIKFSLNYQIKLSKSIYSIECEFDWLRSSKLRSWSIDDRKTK